MLTTNVWAREPLKQWSKNIHILCKEVQDFCLGLREGENESYLKI